MALTSGTFEVDPVSRIEGHLGVKVTVANGAITEADAHGNLWRGFENFLVGRRVNDAITFTQRICGVCPVPHGTAATMAADSVLGVSSGYATFAYKGTGSDGVPEAALHVRNLVLAAEFLMSSITHFYHLVAQSYVQGPPVPPWTPYFKDGQYHSALRHGSKVLPAKTNGLSDDVWSAVITQYVKALRIRRLTFEAGAMFAGRMPMMSNAVAGGTTNTFQGRADFDARCNAFRKLIEEVGAFVIREYVPLALALGALYPDFDNPNNIGLAELSTHPTVAGKGRGFGAGLGNFLAWGGFPQSTDDMAIKGGWIVDATAASPLSGKLLEKRAGLVTEAGSLAYAKDQVETNLKEFISRSRYSDPLSEFTNGAAYPGAVTRTVPERNDSSKYSWMKAPRWNGYAMEVGPFARMVINQKYLVNGAKLVDGSDTANDAQKLYAAIYGYNGSNAATESLNGIDLRVLDPDLVAGLVGSGVADPITNFVANVRGGLSTMDRLRARAIESAWMIAFMLGVPSKGTDGVLSFPTANAASENGWLGELQRLGGANPPEFFRVVTPPTGIKSGFGLVEAPRGALGHFVTADAGKIHSYQCVVPTTWNGSPKDGPTSGVVAPNVPTGTHRGAIEQAMMNVAFDGTPISTGTAVNQDGANTMNGAVSGVEVLRVAQSFDPCIACAVH